MGEKEFVFNINVAKLELRNEWNTSENAIVKFEWGDDPEFAFEMGQDRISRLEFDEQYNIEFKRNVDEFIEKLETIQFRLTVFERKGRAGADDEASQPGRAPLGDETANLVMVEAPEEERQIVGQTESTWPIKLIKALKANEFITTPFTEQYSLKQDEKQVGNITLSFLLHFKCEESPRKFDQSTPFVDQKGTLGIFKEIEPTLDPNDIFFVIGNSPCPVPMTSNLLGNCGGNDQCPARFEADHYRFMQGTLVEDCSGLGGCGSPDCCQMKDDMDICNEVFEELKPKPVPGACCLDPCEQIFGPIRGLRDGPTCTDLNLPCHAEFHTIECTLERNKNQKRKKKSCSCIFKSKPKDRKRTNDQIMKDIMENDPYEQRKKEILYPHTCPTPQLLAPAEPVQPRSCPVCCEDISWVPLYGTCPKCGFAPKIITPLEERAYDENKTAQQILDQWKEETTKFRREQKISKFGACYCTPQNECLNCQLRKFSRKRHRTHKTKGQRSCEDKSDEVSCEEEGFEGDEECERGEGEGEVNRIIDDFLPKSGNKVSTRWNYKRPDYKIPSIKRIIKWCKKKSLSKTGEHFFDKGLPGSESSSISKSSEDITCGRGKTFLQSGNERGSMSSETKQRKVSQEMGSKKQKKDAQNRMKRKVRYFSNDEYPGVVLGHKYCVGAAKKIPRYMGWLWSASIDGRRRGWRPGAVRRETHRIMKYFLEDRIHPIEVFEEKPQLPDIDENIPRRIKDFNLPTLRVIKKDGQFHITLQPVYDPTKSYDPTNKRSIPIEFVIEKDPMEIVKREIKSRLKRLGFKSCTCGRPIYQCECREESDRENLEDAFDNLCQEMCAPQLKDTLYFSETTKSESEIEMEFSPPAAINRQPVRMKPSTAYAETQCNAEDIKVGPVAKSVWKYNPKEFISRKGHPCGGISKLPQCWSPQATMDSSKKNGDEAPTGDKHKRPTKPNKPKSESALLRPSKDKSDGDEKKKSESKTTQNKPASSHKIQKPEKGKGGSTNKLPSAINVDPSKPKKPISGANVVKPGTSADKKDSTDDDDKKDDNQGKSDTKPQGPKPSTKPDSRPHKKPGLKPPVESNQSKPERPSQQKDSTRRSTTKSMEEKHKENRPNINRPIPVRPPPIRPSQPAGNKKPSEGPEGEPKKPSIVPDRKPPENRPKGTAQTNKRFSLGTILNYKKPNMVTTINKKVACPDVSLTRVRFKPHECHKSAALACPSDVKVQKDNNSSCLRMISV